ncbi:unnamed protein product [Rotaria socialis]|uniref:DUF6970 domain-containing protein n=3 Tax=Rotaria socialis TaxID=392032 RepID=A0A818I855_9BILA|nr:unnamed protein product [Rotaria socialis]CAF3521236.1 unnamed protein product [Rotaria socialis]CAF3621154.1 unnamed protein product [Rotaria socialis]CAF4563196.1 unnamed protein product [Rotaria socialis]CAF4957415.1 unnamed protein product [Rotaria socialis]
MQIFILSIVLLFAVVSLGQGAIPACIQEKIDSVLAGPVWNPPATITKYSYDDKTTYLFSSNCCDQFNSLYDESCNHICAPSGGFTGRGDGRCVNFQRDATFLGKVWVDTRSRGK